MGVLAFLVVAFGIFPNEFPLKLFFYQSAQGGIDMPGVWKPLQANLMLAVPILAAALMYLIALAAKRPSN
jgi:hypothetical protein